MKWVGLQLYSQHIPCIIVHTHSAYHYLQLLGTDDDLISDGLRKQSDDFEREVKLWSSVTTWRIALPLHKLRKL